MADKKPSFDSRNGIYDNELEARKNRSNVSRPTTLELNKTWENVLSNMSKAASESMLSRFTLHARFRPRYERFAAWNQKRK